MNMGQFKANKFSFLKAFKGNAGILTPNKDTVGRKISKNSIERIFHSSGGAQKSDKQ